MKQMKIKLAQMHSNAFKSKHKYVRCLRKTSNVALLLSLLVLHTSSLYPASICPTGKSKLMFPQQVYGGFSLGFLQLSLFIMYEPNSFSVIAAWERSVETGKNLYVLLSFKRASMCVTIRFCVNVVLPL